MPPKKKRDDKAVKYDRDLASKVKYIVDVLGEYESVAEYLTALTRAQVEKDFARALKKSNAKKPPEAPAEE